MSKILQWATVLATLLMVVGAIAPSVGAESNAPETVFSAPYDTRSPISGIAMDARANFAVAVVDVDQTSTTLPTGSRPKDDVFLFEMREPATGLKWSDRHESANRTGQVQTEQKVAFAAGATGGSTGHFVVGGPGNHVTFLKTNGPTPVWGPKKTEVDGTIADVAVTPDASRVIVAVNPSTGAGRVIVYDAKDGRHLWTMPLTDAAGQAVKATVLETARASNTLVIGHTRGITVVNPKASDVPSEPALQYSSARGAVSTIDVSRDGDYFVVGTDRAQGESYACMYYFSPEAKRSDPPSPYNRCLHSDGVTASAISLDGARFAVGTAEGEVHFYERVDDGRDLAQEFRDPVTNQHKFVLESGRGVVDLDYDADGVTLVATSPSDVAAFHASRVRAPVWRLSGESDLRLDAPLTGARISDDGERILVAGASRVTALKVAWNADVTVTGGLKRSALPGDVIRYEVEIRNTGSAADTFTWRMSAPAGWAFDQPRNVKLLPGETERVLVNLTAPRDASPRSFLTTANLESDALRAQGKTPVVDTLRLNVTLNRIVDIRVGAEERNLEVDRGQEVAFPFTVTNDGNANVVVNLSASQRPSAGGSWTVRFEPEQLTIRPGDAATSTAFLTAPPDGQDGDANLVTIHARVGNPVTVSQDYRFTARVNPQFALDVDADRTQVNVLTGKTEYVTITLTNDGNTADTVNLTSRLTGASAADWKVTLDRSTIDLRPGESRDVSLGVRANAADAAAGEVVFTATSQGSGASRDIRVQVDLAEVETSGGFPVPLPPLTVLIAALGAGLLTRRQSRQTR